MGDGLDSAQLNGLVRQQAQAPAGVALGRLGAGQSGDLGPLLALDTNRAARTGRIFEHGQTVTFVAVAPGRYRVVVHTGVVA